MSLAIHAHKVFCGYCWLENSKKLSGLLRFGKIWEGFWIASSANEVSKTWWVNYLSSKMYVFKLKTKAFFEVH